ncbi:3-deoxy-D-manno-octulosonic acid transferase [Pseudorhodobacter sp. MZDSW-24AT]|uniref:3-deoxy-D-manno-octulosonic acid transferase n=1 Tax=Pseudorhodobacter sp. MZDSW-24AT TaxID=2052957 RepID=UPI000C1EF910|nr:glycosyltransferase N-terminal domain-containing protein [Pseudorhodobacter sp. MZDSW-24AT]PJF09908.1 3-deoxy-D-manno-octulosonic acid transferase [Pseudorhodobacter sp. MZDSW-24AT]
MVHSLGLTLYNLRPRRVPSKGAVWADRPEGRVIWMHAPSVETSRGLFELAGRLIDEEQVTVLFSCADPLPERRGIICVRPPEDRALEARAFLEHWRPEIALFSDGELRPAVLHAASEIGLHQIMVDGRTPYVLKDRNGWYPGLMRSTLQGFTRVLTMDEAAARAFRKGGAPLSAVSVVGRMEEDSTALPCLEAERAALAKLLATRPVWLAVGLPEAEEAAVIAAHRAAQSLAHRLLLIIAPEDPARAQGLAKRLADEEGWIVAERAEDQEPDADVEVFIADGVAELGLWYRLAPITFMGGSLAGQGCIRNPMEPAALGSAILYGPRPGVYGSTFGRLGAARAARAVGSASDLGEALSDLLSPDRAARLAQAAWSVASDGAEVTEQVLTVVRRVLAGEK